jgi:tRNA pseudouridine38-40 synthase
VRRVRVTLGYDGTHFHGSQKQRGVRTVQEEFERALQRVASGSGSTAFAGRTDRGVHADGQVVSADVQWSRPASALRVALDATTPADIMVRDVQDASASFHARFDARWREYRYRIRVADTPPVLDARYVWWRRMVLDDDAVAVACRHFTGRRAFGAFVGSGWSRSRSVRDLTRDVRECEWRRSDRWDAGEHIVDCELRVVANGFLPQMVRNMVAALVEVGAGRRDPAWVASLLERGDRGEMVEAAPAHGLSLWRVEYDEDDSIKGSATHGEYEED